MWEHFIEVWEKYEDLTRRIRLRNHGPIIAHGLSNLNYIEPLSVISNSRKLQLAKTSLELFLAQFHTLSGNSETVVWQSASHVHDITAEQVCRSETQMSVASLTAMLSRFCSSLIAEIWRQLAKTLQNQLPFYSSRQRKGYRVLYISLSTVYGHKSSMPKCARHVL